VKEISIGEFARRSHLSLKALRLYDKRGVLVPSRVDRVSGYRYYDAAQLDQARLVVMMRQLQLPLKTVRELRERPLPTIEGRAGAFFCIYWSHPMADSDGLIEWCKPVPQAEAHALAERYPELTLRTEPAHLEIYVSLPGGYGAAQWNLACESLDAWAQEQALEHEGDRLALTPEDLGLRTTYLPSGPMTPGNIPDDYIDLAIPFAVEP
jgi:DNA-binding transcriptional MerR regulator